MALAGTAYIDFQGRYGGLIRGADRAVKDVNSRFAGLSKGITNSLGGAAREVGRSISAGLSVGAAAVTALGTQAIVAGGQYNALGQRATAAMETVLGSAEAAKQMMGELMEFASASPFPRQVFVEATQEMLAFGFAAEDVIPILGAVEDAVAAAGGSSQQIEEVVTVLSQIQSAGKITGTDLLQLGQRGINAADLIGSSLGMSGQQIKDSITAGTLDSEVAIEALTTAMETQFGGAAANLKGTWTGAVQSIQARSRDLGAALMEPFIGFAGGGALAVGLGAITDSLRQFTETSEDGSVRFIGALEPMNGAAQKLADFVQRALETVAGFIDKLGTIDLASVTGQFDGLAPVIGGVAAALGVGLGSQLPVIGGFLGSVNPLVAALGAMIALSPELRETFGDALAQVFAALEPLIEPALALFQQLVETILPPLLALLPTVTSAFEQLFVALEPVIPILAGALAEAMASIAPILPDLVAGLVELTTGVLLMLIPLIPVLADMFVLLVPPLVSFLTVLVDLLAKVPPPLLLALFGSFFVLFKVLGILFKFKLAITVVSLAMGKLGIGIPFVTKGLGILAAPSLKAAAGFSKFGVATRLLGAKFPHLAKAISLIAAPIKLVAGLIGKVLVGAFNLVLAHPVIAAIALLGVAFYLLYTKCQPFRDIVDSIIDVLGEMVAPVVDLVKALFSGDGLSGAIEKVTSFLGPLQDFGGAWLDYVLTPIQTVVSIVRKLLKGDFGGAFLDMVTMVPKMLGKLGKLIWEGISALVPLAWKAAKLLVPALLGWLGDVLPQIPGKLWGLVTAIVAWVAEAVPKLAAAFGRFIGPALGWIGDFLAKLPGRLLGIITALLSWIGREAGQVGTAFLEWGRMALDWVVKMAREVGPKLGAFLLSVLAWVAQALPMLGMAFLRFVPVALGWIVRMMVTVPLKLAEFALAILNWIGTTAVKLGAWFITSFLPAALSWIVQLLISLPGKLLGIVTAIWGWITATGPGLAAKILEFAAAFFNWVVQSLIQLPGKLAGIVTAIWGWITATAVSLGAKVLELGGAFLGWIGDVLVKLPEQLAAIWQTIWSWITSLPGLIAETATVIYDAFVDIGTSMLEGIGAGISAAVEWIGDVAGAIWDAVWGFLFDNVFQPIADFEISIGPYDAKPFKSLLELLGVEGLAKGGYFDRPTAAIIGEAGPELVLPLSDPRRMADLLARYAPAGAPVAAAEGIAVGPTPEAAAPAIDGISAWADAVVARLALLPGEVMAAMAPGMEAWRAQLASLLTNIAAWQTTWLAQRVLAWQVWAMTTLPAATLPPLALWSVRMQSTVTTMATAITTTMQTLATSVANVVAGMIATVTSALSAAASTWSTLGAQAAQRYVNQMTTRLSTGATSVKNIVNGYARSLVNALNPILSAIGQKTIRLAEGAIVTFAGGGLTGGGENHVAQIAPAGAWRVWAEPETGGEAYIPLARSKRPRSRAIAAETVRRLGGAVDWYAGGGVTGPTQGLNPTFLARIVQWAAAVGQNFHITSGYRSVARQAQLYAAYLAGRGNLAARPGSSMHNVGLAIDGPHWGRYNPGAFGLTYRVRGEPWHVEPIEGRAMAGGDAFGFNALPEVPAIERTGALADVARALMTFARDKSVEWTSTALAEMAGSVGGLAPMSGPALDIGQRMAAARGWTGVQWQALYNLWTKESGWNPLADNPTSSAYGIPQALPGSKMSSHGADWRTNPQTQIAWGLDYIAGRYGSPLAAWRHSQAHNWYRRGGLAFVHRGDFDRGGVLRPGPNLVTNNTGADEHLVPAGGRSAVTIREAHFHEGVDYDLFLRKTAFMMGAGRI